MPLSPALDKRPPDGYPRRTGEVGRPHVIAHLACVRREMIGAPDRAARILAHAKREAGEERYRGAFLSMLPSPSLTTQLLCCRQELLLRLRRSVVVCSAVTSGRDRALSSRVYLICEHLPFQDVFSCCCLNVKE